LQSWPVSSSRSTVAFGPVALLDLDQQTPGLGALEIKGIAHNVVVHNSVYFFIVWSLINETPLTFLPVIFECSSYTC